jgi:cholesterol transport system auxiliary component
VSATAIFGGCATQQLRESNGLFDFGILRSAQNTTPSPALPPLSIAEVDTPRWMDSGMMFYRLAYANDQQPYPYANSRWTAPPGQLFGQRLKARIGQGGGAVFSASDGVANVPTLRIEVDDFSQIFTNPEQSVGRINARASVLDGRTLVAHKNFSREVPAPTADAAGGAKALATASDAVISDIMNWLAGLQLKR